MNNILLGQTNGIIMPLLMGFTNPTQIQVEENFEPIMYDPVSQTVYEMKMVGTKSLKSHRTDVVKGVGKGIMDKKNEIDDQKYVQG